MARGAWVLGMMLAAGAGPAAAQDWRAMPVHGHDLGFIDADSVVRRGGTIRFRAQLRLDENPSNSDFGYDRVDLRVTGRCAQLRADPDALVTAERLYSRRGRRVAEPGFMAGRSVEEATSLADLVCSGIVGARGFASVEAAMATPGGREAPDLMAAYRSDEVELTGTVVQGFEMNGIQLCGSETGCVDGAQAEFCWLEGSINVPAPAGAPEWVGGSLRRDSADFVFRGRILRSRTGRGFGHVDAFGCQVIPAGPARRTTITQRMAPRSDRFAPGRRPAAVAANAALVAMMAGAGTVRLAQGTGSWAFNEVVPGSSDMSAACYSTPKFNGGWLDSPARGLDWAAVAQVSRAGATVTVAQSGYDENLTFATSTPARAAQLKTFAERLVARRVTAVEQQGRRVTIRFEGGRRETMTFPDAGLAIEAAGIADKLAGREIAAVRQDTNRFYALPLERSTLTFDSEARAAEAQRLMEALRAACLPGPGEG